jgi:integrase
LSRNFDTKRERDDFLDEIHGGGNPDAGREVFSSFAPRWAAAQDWKDTSRQGWESVYRRLERHLGAMPLDKIDSLVLKALQMTLMEEEGYARTTVELTMSQAKSVMKAAYATGAIKRDPTIGLRAPKARAGEPDGVVRPEDVPTRAEVLAILNASPPRFRAAIALGSSGLRIGEVMAVTEDRLDHSQLRIDRQLQRIKDRSTGVWENRFTTPKAEKLRTIILPPTVLLEVRRHIRDYPAGEDGLLFLGGRGAMLRRYYLYDQAWKPALVAAGLAPSRFKFHSLRHHAASWMLAEGTPITAVAGYLGDAVETVQRVYAHWLRDDQHVPAAVLDRMFAPERSESQTGLTSN